MTSEASVEWPGVVRVVPLDQVGSMSIAGWRVLHVVSEPMLVFVPLHGGVPSVHKVGSPGLPSRDYGGPNNTQQHFLFQQESALMVLSRDESLEQITKQDMAEQAKLLGQVNSEHALVLRGEAKIRELESRLEESRKSARAAIESRDYEAKRAKSSEGYVTSLRSQLAAQQRELGLVREHFGKDRVDVVLSVSDLTEMQRKAGEQ